MSLRNDLDEIISKMQDVPTKTADAPLSESDWNSVAINMKRIKEALTKIKDLPACTIPKGFLYVRFPGRPLPYGADGVFNWTNEADWKKIHEQYKGDFLRLAGGNASAFKADDEKIDHDEKCKDKDNKPNTGGGQKDAIQNHRHPYTDNSVYGKYTFSPKQKNGWTGRADVERKTDGIIEARTDIETRPTNITVEMYLYMPD